MKLNGQENINVLEAIKRVEHPAIATTLLDLGMVRDITVTPDGKAALTLALPLPNIPDNIQDFLIKSLKSAALAAGGNLSTVKLALMDEEERQNFLAKEKLHWRG
ncbi:MAG: DUF59 domain-containing protein [Anaerolineales bacterium]|nr:DUF59 domain-containing protein [Anaerolineales bacterium]